MAGVSLKDIVKVYPSGVKAVDGFNMDIIDKEFIVLVGPSGCGKTTTLRMIAGLEEITEGEIYIGDKLVNGLAPKDRNIAMVFQSHALYPHMTVYKNMAFGLKLRKVPKAEIDTAIKDVAEVLDIGHLLDRKPNALSGGERQRVALGRAMVREPEAFLLDEPLSSLDAKLRAAMRAELVKLHKRLGSTFIYVTHDQAEAMTMGDRIVVMHLGVTQQIDSPKQLYDFPNNLFVAGFIGTPPMNFIDGIVQKVDDKFFFAVEDSLIPLLPERMDYVKLAKYEGKDVAMGVRPEDLHVEAPHNAEAGFGAIKTHIEIVEMLGSELHVHLKIKSGVTVIMRCSVKEEFSVTEYIMTAVDCNKLHLFDKHSGEAIGRPNR